MTSSKAEQFPTADRTAAILQGNDQVASLFLELNQRQTVIGQMSDQHGLRPPDWIAPR
jgi:hypothetical protein